MTIIPIDLTWVQGTSSKTRRSGLEFNWYVNLANSRVWTFLITPHSSELWCLLKILKLRHSVWTSYKSIQINYTWPSFISRNICIQSPSSGSPAVNATITCPSHVTGRTDARPRAPVRVWSVCVIGTETGTASSVVKATGVTTSQL